MLQHGYGYTVLHFDMEEYARQPFRFDGLEDQGKAGETLRGDLMQVGFPFCVPAFRFHIE